MLFIAVRIIQMQYSPLSDVCNNLVSCNLIIGVDSFLSFKKEPPFFIEASSWQKQCSLNQSIKRWLLISAGRTTCIQTTINVDRPTISHFRASHSVALLSKPHKFRRSPDLEALKLCKGRSGRIKHIDSKICSWLLPCWYLYTYSLEGKYPDRHIHNFKA